MAQKKNAPTVSSLLGPTIFAALLLLTVVILVTQHYDQKRLANTIVEAVQRDKCPSFSKRQRTVLVDVSDDREFVHGLMDTLNRRVGAQSKDVKYLMGEYHEAGALKRVPKTFALLVRDLESVSQFVFSERGCSRTSERIAVQRGATPTPTNRHELVAAADAFSERMVAAFGEWHCPTITEADLPFWRSALGSRGFATTVSSQLTGMIPEPRPDVQSAVVSGPHEGGYFQGKPSEPGFGFTEADAPKWRPREGTVSLFVYDTKRGRMANLWLHQDGCTEIPTE